MFVKFVSLLVTLDQVIKFGRCRFQLLFMARIRDVDRDRYLPHRLQRIVFDHSWYISTQLNYTQLLPYFLIPKYNFLSNEELQQLNELRTDQQKANKLLLLLRAKPISAFRKFVACLVEENEHLGHEDLSRRLLCATPPLALTVVKKIKQLVSKKDRMEWLMKNQDSPRPFIQAAGSTSSINAIATCGKPGPEPPMSLIEYRGCLTRKKYDKLDRRLWDYFSNGWYDDLDKLTRQLADNHKAPIDLRIIGKWFEALIVMHRDGSYETCLKNVLQPALEMCSQPEVQNQNILEGRINQRMAQVCLMMGRKKEAEFYLEKAEGLLQHVARGYDRVNMFCRRAKILCATSDNREEIEEAFNKALDNVMQDDSFALASYPSICLSKAAFHLKISFGSKPTTSDTQKLLCPDVSQKDIIKARKTLQDLPSQMILLHMRKCERKLLDGELCRLDGKPDLAIQIFTDVIKESTAKLGNIAAIALHRLGIIQSEISTDSFIDEVLEGMPEVPKLSITPC